MRVPPLIALLVGFCFGVPAAWLVERTDLDLKPQIKNLSKGNKQKVGIVQALMHRPDLLLLDEPTSGLDPLGTRWMGLSAPGVGIHGTDEPSSIGYSASHGCIRVPNFVIERLYATEPYGETVVVY